MRSDYFVLRLNKRVALFVLLLFFLEPPGYINHLNSSAFHYLMIMGEFLAYLYILVKHIIKKRFSIIVFLSILMYGCIVLSTALNGGSTFASIRYSMGFVLMGTFLFNEIDNVDDLLKACVIYLLVMITVNFVTIVTIPEGMYTVYTSYMGKQILGQTAWFFANKNGIGKYCLYLLFFLSIRDYKKGGNLSPLFFFGAAICIATTVAVWSATSIVTTILFVVFIVLTPIIRRIKPKAFDVYYFTIALVIIFIAFILVQNVSFAGGFIERVLRKSTTFNGRTLIWNNVIYLFRKKPFLGYGYISNVDARVLIGHKAASDAHNMFLTDLLYGGASCLCFFILIISILIRKIKANQYSYDGIVLTSFVFCFFLMCLFENTSSTIYWIIIAYGFYIFREKVKYGRD